ncbi:hypothetical protein AGMMS49983_09520 [Clostridia bacterium]|nr:hypothetical protein AGMMS49983_09520 [Clostridia bacterium]
MELALKKHFRVHGDNIVECERVISYITRNAVVHSFSKTLSSLACLTVDLDFEYAGTRNTWSIEMFPGFSKDNRSQRWQSNIFDALKANGSFLDETPDVVVTNVDNGKETVLFAIEFCSALQAGNQAWQRSGRAYSIGRTTCPYIYIVDFVKYELDSETRERKALRFPNPAVPFSYISFSKQTGGFVAQAYVQAEEFRITDKVFESFDSEWFSEQLVCDFIFEKMLGVSTAQTELKILENNFSVVTFLTSRGSGANSFTVDDWQAIFDTDADILEYSKDKTDGFNFAKKVSQKSQTEAGKIGEFSSLIRDLSVGVASKDLPFGLLPSDKISAFVGKLKEIYPAIASEFDVLNSISEDCLVCMIKGFKPRGDDNRPDRGILPLVAMLTSEKVYVLSYIYGPLIERNYRLLLSDPIRLSEISGFWRAFLSLSDFLLLDAPLLNTSETINKFIDNRDVKQRYITQGQTGEFVIPAISNIPIAYHEDDVDTVLHYMFSYLLDNTFEGMCNPPGGDWSGLSVRLNDCEYRWLSLPRVSNASKRPDHVAELFIPDSKPILFVVESKERGNDLETDIGVGLKGYLHWLMNFSPSVSKSAGGEWEDTDENIDVESFEFISAGAFINDSRYDNQRILKNSKCDLLFLFTPDETNGFWKIEILANVESQEADKIKRILLEQLACEDDGIFITVSTQLDN